MSRVMGSILFVIRSEKPRYFSSLYTQKIRGQQLQAGAYYYVQLVVDTIQYFLCKLGMKPRMQLWEIVIFSQKHVIVRPTRIIKNLCKSST